MSRQRAFLLIASLFIALSAGQGMAGLRQVGVIDRQPDAGRAAMSREPVVLAQIAPGTSEVQAVVEASAPPAEAPGVLERVREFLAESYQREPALMIALALVFVLSPIISVLLFVSQSAKKAIVQRKTRRGESLKQAMQAAGSTTATTEPGGAAFWNAEAALEFIDADYDPLPLHGRMLRIGRHEENDVRLADKTVHRHHAVLQLNGEQGYTITDLSGTEGNGVLVNSERVTQARLRDGDIIELGAVKLRFALNRGQTSGRPAGQTQVTLH